MTSEFEKSFSFYLSYHSNHTNQWIHIFCVWPILFASQILLQYTPPLDYFLPFLKTMPLYVSTSSYLPVYMAVNINLLMTVRYVTYYAIIEQPGYAGIIASFMAFGGYLFSTNIVAMYPDVWKIALGVKLFCWAAQIYGHQIFEKRSPAFMSNVSQALVMGPLFVLMEVMYESFGYRAEFKRAMKKIADENIRNYNLEKSKLQSNK